MIERPKKMWEILNVVPIIEVQTATPEQLTQLTSIREQERRSRQHYQSIIDKPISEVFPETPRQKPQE